MMLHANIDTTNRRRNGRRERSNSSLDGFIVEPLELPTVDENLCIQDQEELRMLHRRLRQVKRRLLLKYVEKPTSSVDQLRGLILQVAMKENNNNNNDENSMIGNQAAQLWLKDQASVSHPSKTKNEVAAPVTKVRPLEANKTSSGPTPLKPCSKVVSSIENKNSPVLNTRMMERNKVVASMA